MDVSRYVNELMSDRNVLELVASMQPLDIAKCIQNSLGLLPKQALVVTLSLLTNVAIKEYVETNKQFPVPNKKTDDENEIPSNVKEFISQKPEPFKAAEIPPSPRQNAEKWPYDANTLFINDPKIKGQKRPLMQNYEPVAKSKKNQVGGQGLGTFQTSLAAANQNGTADGGSSWDTKGVSGWSRSLSSKEFDKIPNDTPEYFPIEKKG